MGDEQGGRTDLVPNDGTFLRPPREWRVDERLESIERHLELLGISDEAVERFVETWNIADEPERARLYALGDVRLTEELRVQADPGASIYEPEPVMTGIEHPADGTFSPEIHGDGTGTALPPVEEDTEALEIVEGTVPDVVGWVNGDPDRARRAMVAEMMMADPRRSLIGRLEKLADV